MCLSLRYTDSLGRSCVPETLLRTAHFRRCNRTAFFVCLSDMVDQPRGASVVFEAPVECYVLRAAWEKSSTPSRSTYHAARAYFAPAPANALPGLILTT